MEHKEIFCRNNHLNPASTDEPKANIAIDLLLDKDDNDVCGNKAIFVIVTSSDNDTRVPSCSICKQKRIIGLVADNMADHAPDRGHVIKMHEQ
jgi:hypothetical protein